MQVSFTAAELGTLDRLRQISRQLSDHQTRIATGKMLRVQNAANFALADRLIGDMAGYASIDTSLGLGRAMVDSAVSGAGSLKALADEMQNVVLRANQSGADHAALETELSDLKTQYRALLSATSFNGANLLGTDDVAPISSSLPRSSSGLLSVGTIALAAQNFNFAAPLETGATGGSAIANTSATGSGTLATSDVASLSSENYTPAVGDEFYVSINGTRYGYVVEAGDSATEVFANFRQVAENAAALEGVALEVRASRNDDPGYPSSGVRRDVLTVTNEDASDVLVIIGTAAAGTRTAGTVAESSLLDQINVGTASDAADALALMDRVMDGIVSKTATLGSLSRRISIQQDFNSAFTNSVEAGISQLTDIDIAAETVRFEAVRFQYDVTLQNLRAMGETRSALLGLFT